jgi:glycosyltransferase involved in cell wall biosynthesis
VKKKTIYFDGLAIVDGHFSGIGQYTLGILRSVDKYIDSEKLKGNEPPKVKIIIPKDMMHVFYGFKFKHLIPAKFPMKFRTMAGLWHKGKMPPLDLLYGRGYYVFTRFVTMPLMFSKSAVVIYDLSFELYSQYADEKNAKFLSKGTKKSIKQVDQIFTISKNSKTEIKDFYSFPASKIHVAPPAADPAYFYKRSESEIAKVKREYGITKNYILALSNLEPRKNLETLVDAYCKLPKKYRDQYSLLLVGVSGWKTDQLFKKIIDLVNDGFDIIRPNKYVSDLDKPAVISGASMLVYPSHYEGFGMPPLEALACGTPVITADNSSLPEVVGKAGIMLDCTDTAEFTKEMQKIIDSIDDTTEKVMLTGPKQAAKFNWDESAQIYIKNILKEAEK